MICYYFREAFLYYFPLKAVLNFSPQEKYNGHLFQGAGKEQLSKTHSALKIGLYFYTVGSVFNTS